MANAGKVKSGQFATQHFYDVPSQVLVDLAVSRDRLGEFCRRILIPIVASSMANEDAAEFLDFLDEVAMLHATSNSA